MPKAARVVTGQHWCKHPSAAAGASGPAAFPRRHRGLPPLQAPPCAAPCAPGIAVAASLQQPSLWVNDGLTAMLQQQPDNHRINGGKKLWVSKFPHTDHQGKEREVSFLKEASVCQQEPKPLLFCVFCFVGLKSFSIPPFPSLSRDYPPRQS